MLDRCFLQKKIYVLVLIKKMQLISGRDNGEQELVRFLKPYRRVTNPQLCAQNITLPQLTLWVYVDSRWVRKDGKNMKGDQTRSGSWCHLYLGSGYTSNQYAKIKRDLFASSRGLSGVYQDKANQMYAVVYKPTMQLSNAAIAALVGGTALAGIAGAKYARRTESKKQDPVMTEGADEEGRLSTWRDEFMSVLRGRGTQPLTENDFEWLDEFRKLKSKQKTTTYSNFSYTLMEPILQLGAIGVSYDDVLGLNNGSITDVINSHIFKDFGPNYDDILHNIGLMDTKYSDRYEAAKIMNDLQECVDANNFTQFETNGDTKLNRLLKAMFRSRDSKYNAYKAAWYELVEKYAADRPDVVSLLYAPLLKEKQNAKHAFTDAELQKITSDAQALQIELIKKVEGFRAMFKSCLNTNKVPIISAEDGTQFRRLLQASDALSTDLDKVRDVISDYETIASLQKLNVPRDYALIATESLNGREAVDGDIVHFAKLVELDQNTKDYFNSVIKNKDTLDEANIRNILRRPSTPNRYASLTLAIRNSSRIVVGKVGSDSIDQIEEKEKKLFDRKLANQI